MSFGKLRKNNLIPVFRSSDFDVYCQPYFEKRRNFKLADPLEPLVKIIKFEGHMKRLFLKER
jgi:hypothetical protein